MKKLILLVGVMSLIGSCKITEPTQKRSDIQIMEFECIGGLDRMSEEEYTKFNMSNDTIYYNNNKIVWIDNVDFSDFGDNQMIIVNYAKVTDFRDGDTTIRFMKYLYNKYMFNLE